MWRSGRKGEKVSTVVKREVALRLSRERKVRGGCQEGAQGDKEGGDKVRVGVGYDGHGG